MIGYLMELVGELGPIYRIPLVCISICTIIHTFIPKRSGRWMQVIVQDAG